MTLAALPVMAFAAASKLTLSSYTDGVPINYKYGTGNIIVNNPKGKVNLITEVTLKKAEPNHKFYVYAWVDQDWTGTIDWTKLYELGSFTTNKQGNGNFHFNNVGQLLPIASLPTGEHKFRFVITDDNLADQVTPTGWSQAIQGLSVYTSDWSPVMKIK